MMFKNCEKCNKKFEKLVSTSKKRWKLQRFCSIKCSNTLIKKGEPLPEKMVKGMRSRFIKNLNFLERGGELNSNWRGGISMQFIRAAVLRRDNQTCQDCGHHEPDIMEVDHIKPKAEFPELAKNISNLVTLCPNCHRRKTNRELREKGQNPRRQAFINLKEN